MLYKRGKIWWFKFTFGGRVIRESTKSPAKDVARRAETHRRRALEEGYHGLRRREAPPTFKSAAERWLTERRITWAPKTSVIARSNIGHLLPVFGGLLLPDVTAEHIAGYQRLRRGERASNKTINLEVGSLRAVLQRHRLWAAIQPDVRMLTTRNDHGRALTPDDEGRLLDTCCRRTNVRRSCPRSCWLSTPGCGIRRFSIRWRDVNLRPVPRCGRRARPGGPGRVVLLNDPAVAVLTRIADLFPDRRDEHFVFAAERYGVAGDQAPTTPTLWIRSRPIRSLKEAWESAETAGAGSGADSTTCDTPPPRGCWKTGFRSLSSGDPRLERVDDRAHGEALRPHRQMLTRPNARRSISSGGPGPPSPARP